LKKEKKENGEKKTPTFHFHMKEERGKSLTKSYLTLTSKKKEERDTKKGLSSIHNKEEKGKKPNPQLPKKSEKWKGEGGQRTNSNQLQEKREREEEFLIIIFLKKGSRKTISYYIPTTRKRGEMTNHLSTGLKGGRREEGEEL